MLISLLAVLSFAGGPNSTDVPLLTLLRPKDQALLDAFALQAIEHYGLTR